MELEALRKEIDALDDGIAEAFAKRLALCDRVADYKKEHGLPIFVPEREAAVLARLAAGRDADTAQALCTLYKTVFAISRAREEKKL